MEPYDFVYFYIFSFFSDFQTWLYQTRWFYPNRSFKYSKWWRQKLGHTYNIRYRLINFAHFVVKIDEKCSHNGYMFEVCPTCTDTSSQASVQFDQSIIDAAISQWRRRLSACVRARGAHFEHKFWQFWTEVLIGTYNFANAKHLLFIVCYLSR